MRNSGFHTCEEDHCCYVKKQLSENFEMKDLGPAKQILGMRISRDRSKGILNLSQEKYIKKLLSKFNVGNAKTRNTHLGTHLKFSKRQSSHTEEEEHHMSKVPYASAVGSLMYAMVCTRPISLYRGFLMQIWKVIWMVERAQQIIFLRWVSNSKRDR